MTEFKSIQELLNALYSCIAIDDKGNAYLRTNSSGVTPDPGPGPGPGPDPDPTPTFTQVGGQDENTSSIYSQYLRNANLLGIHCQVYENGGGSFSTELSSNTLTTINFAGTGTDDLAFADVGVKNENGVIYLQNADTLKWLKPSTFQIKCGHLIAVKKLNAGAYDSPNYAAPSIIIGDQKDNGYGDLLGKLSSLIPGIQDHSDIIYHNLFEGMFATSPRLANVNVFYPYIIGQNIYRRMFADCPILNTANLYISDKPIVTTECISLAESIFDGCRNLSKLNAQIKCYTIPAAKMFANAFNNTQVNSLTIEAQSISDVYKVEDLDYPLYNWLGGASNRQGTITKPYALTLTENSDSGIPTNWTVRNTGEPPTPPEPEKPDLDTFDPNVPFCIENVGDVPVEIGLSNITSNIRTDCEISYNNKDWITYKLLVDPGPPDIEKITLSNKGDRVYIKANHPGTVASPTPYTHIRVLNESTSTKIQARGNIASLSYAKDDVYKTNYYNTLPDACYVGLFMGCKSLVKAPDLPAGNLSKLCYRSMFSGCTNLKYIYSAATNISASNCTLEWVKGVASTGDFYAQSPAIVNWTTGDNGIPAGWTRHQIYSD